jgi:hypothetical protein
MAKLLGRFHKGATMKKLIAIILCLLCYSAEARMLMVVGGGVPVVDGCGTFGDYNDGTNASLSNSSYSTTYMFPFTPSASGTVASISLKTKSCGAGCPIPIKAAIAPDSTNYPGAVTYGTEQSITNSTETEKVLPFASSYAVTGGQQYWIGWTADVSGDGIYVYGNASSSRTCRLNTEGTYSDATPTWGENCDSFLLNKNDISIRANCD